MNDAGYDAMLRQFEPRNLRWKMTIQSIDISGVQPEIYIQDNGIATIRTFHRIHCFSLDLSDRLGLRSGGMGLSVPSLPIFITARLTDAQDKVPKMYEDVLRILLERLRGLVGRKYWEILVEGPIYRHAGLGSTTQVLGGAVVAAAASVGRKLDPIELFCLGVGRVSTVGLTPFVFG